MEMHSFDIKKVQYRVTDFINWKRSNSLDLNPKFQRRSVWKKDAKSFFIDTVIKGLPAPIIYLRETVDLNNQDTLREVIDGQQRLRTLFAFIDEGLLEDFKPQKDEFYIKKTHNKVLANKSYRDLSDKLKTRILSYEFSTHILPINTEDRDVLEMFARLNSTGTRLNNQELRNATYFGEFKTVMYELAYEQLERWRKWGVFNEDDISRMKEVEFLSDFVADIIFGINSKTKNKIDKVYKQYNEDFTHKNAVIKVIRDLFDLYDKLVGSSSKEMIYKNEVYFYTLMYHLFENRYGDIDAKSSKISEKSIKNKAFKFNTIIEKEDLSNDLIEIIVNKRSDKKRKLKRLDIFRSL